MTCLHVSRRLREAKPPEAASKRLRSRAAPRIEGKLLSYYKPLLFTHTLSHENLSSQGACADFRAGFVIDKAKIRRNTVCISRIFNAVYGKDCRKDVCAPLRSQVPAWQKRQLPSVAASAFGATRSLLSRLPLAASTPFPRVNLFLPLKFIKGVRADTAYCRLYVLVAVAAPCQRRHGALKVGRVVQLFAVFLADKLRKLLTEILF